MLKKNTIDNNKIGKNDNLDIGSNKYNRNKQILKNVEISNNDFNKSCIELIKEISIKERKIHEIIQKLYECKKCKNNIDEKIKEVDDKIKMLQQKYDLNKQWLSSNPIIYDASSSINNLKNQKYYIKNFYYDCCCNKHKEIFKKIELDRVELNSLKESLNRLKISNK